MYCTPYVYIYTYIVRRDAKMMMTNKFEHRPPDVRTREDPEK